MISNFYLIFLFIIYYSISYFHLFQITTVCNVAHVFAAWSEEEYDAWIDILSFVVAKKYEQGKKTNIFVKFYLPLIFALRGGGRKLEGANFELYLKMRGLNKKVESLEILY